MSDVFTLRGPIKKDRPEPTKRSLTRTSLDGSALGTVELEPTIFGIEPNMAVLHQVVKAQLAAKRAGTQSTKTRKEVSGGGKKPFNQKAPAAPVRERSAHRSTPVVASRSAPSPQVRPEDTQEDDRLALYSPSRTARASSASRSSIASSPGASPRPRRPSRRSRRSHRRQGPGGHHPRRHRRQPVVPEPRLRQDHRRRRAQCYDVLDADWILFTDATLPIAKEHS